MSQPAGYSRLQIALHWLVALLVANQFLFNGPIGAAWRAVRTGAPAPAFDPLVPAHVFGGILIGLLVIARLAVRLTRGTPPLPDSEPVALRVLAHVAHWALYLMLIALVGTGLAGWFGGVKTAVYIHHLMEKPMMALIGLHVAGALFQHYYLKSDVLMRMLRPR